MKKYLATPAFEIGAIAIAIAAALILGMLPSTHTAKANQSTICYNYLNSNATTSKTYMTAGTATTTQTINNCSDGNIALDGGAVLIQVISSTTPPSLGVRYEVSRDGIDYYPWPISSNAGVATTTLQLTGANEYVWRGMASSTDMAGTGIASSSAGTATNLVGSTFNQALVLPSTPFPYMRLKYYVPAGAPAVSISAEALIKREALAR